MAYSHFNPSLPDGATQTGVEVPVSIRLNEMALVDGVIIEGMPGWDLSIVGDPAQPDEVKYTDGLNVLKNEITWNASGNASIMVYSRSYDGEGTWESIGTKTLTWDSNDNIISIDWS